MKRKKVGIISMQRIENYGSFLQGYALKSMISVFTDDVEFVDYKIGKPVFNNVLEKKKYRKDKMAKIIYEAFVKSRILRSLLPKHRGNAIRRSVNYRKNILPKLGVTKRNYNSNKDLIVIGSDEVFNCLQQGVTVGFSPNLFGHKLKSKSISSYAGSFGNTTLERLEAHGLTDKLGEYFSKFNKISVRDNNSKKIVESITSKKAEIHLDPVLVYDFTKELLPIEDIGDYLVIYVYPNRVSSYEVAEIKSFAKQNSLKIISLGNYVPYSDLHFDCSPFELLSYMKNAKYIVTDTFHGTIYSIIFNKQFGTFVRKSSIYGYGNEEKLNFLLDLFNLKGQTIEGTNNLDVVLNKNINYTYVNEVIEMQRNRSMSYLKSIIDEAN